MGGALPTLLLSVWCGGLVLQDYRAYYWAAILITVCWWFVLSQVNAFLNGFKNSVIWSIEVLGHILIFEIPLEWTLGSGRWPGTDFYILTGGPL